LPLLSFGAEHGFEGLILVGGDPGEGQALADAFSRGSGIPGPDHLSLSLDNVMVGLEADDEGCLGLKALGKFHTAAPFAQVASPAHDDSGGRETLGLE
jgi:hypothetical protein